MQKGVSLILVNARVFTMDSQNPTASAVAIAGERIAAVGNTAEITGLRMPGTEIIDCDGLPLIPGLNDAHTHVLATAARLSALDCRSAGIDSVTKLLAAIRDQAAAVPPGRWIRGYGLDPSDFRERRYPTRQELDTVTPGHPVRLEHSSGHAAFLNTRGLDTVGIDAETPDPPDGVIVRDDNGDPTGLLLEMGGYLRQRLGRTRSKEELEAGVSHLSETLVSYGVTSVQDAGPENGPDQLKTFQGLTARQVFQPRVTMMVGAEKLAEVVGAGLHWGYGNDWLRTGHAKIILTCTTGQLMPAPEDLAELALQSWSLGFPVAIHAIEQEAVAEAIHVTGMKKSTDDFVVGDSIGPKFHLGARNRVEHCAECPPSLLKRLALSGAMVVTQPGFVYWRGDGYLERVEPNMLPQLYDSKRLMASGIPVAYGSDSPIIDPNPWPGIYSAVTGMTKRGSKLPWPGGWESSDGREAHGITLVGALSAHSLAGAQAEGTEDRKGMIREEMLADLALLDNPLDENSRDEILRTKSCLTIIGGRIAWKDGGLKAAGE